MALWRTGPKDRLRSFLAKRPGPQSFKILGPLTALFISDLKRRRGGRGGAPPLRGRRHHRRRPPRSRGFGVHPDRRRISTLSTDFRFSFLSWILLYDFVILRIQKQESGLHVSSKFKNLLGRLYRIKNM